MLQPQGEVAEGTHVLPLLVSDSGKPPRVREQLLNVSVCACTEGGFCQARGAALVGAVAGLSFGALMVVLGCASLFLRECLWLQPGPRGAGGVGAFSPSQGSPSACRPWAQASLVAVPAGSPLGRGQSLGPPHSPLCPHGLGVAL